MIIISLGAGVQSTTMALMAARGELTPMPDYAVFADTGDEPADVYAHLAWLMSPGVLPFPVRITKRGVLSEDLLAGDKMARPPLHTAGKGMMPRQCTRNYKLRPIQQEVRRLGGGRGHSCEMWLGISMDEAIRMKPSQVQYITNRWPLIERDMTRENCLQWLDLFGYARPPKSSCWHCPYQSNAQWRSKRDTQPEEWRKAVVFDRAMRSERMVQLNGVEGYLHPKKQPLDQIGLLDERLQPDLFNNDCEGVCGV